jgi:hypothetical protein
MESRLIYVTGKHLLPKIEWQFYGETEWLYCGLSNDFKEAIVIQFVKEHFGDTDLYILLNRNDSHKVFSSEVINTVREWIGKLDFTIWNSNFSKVIEFKPIGVMRYGECLIHTHVPNDE